MIDCHECNKRHSEDADCPPENDPNPYRDFKRMHDLIHMPNEYLRVVETLKRRRK